MSLNQLEPSLVETIIGEVDEPTPSPRHHEALSPFVPSKTSQANGATNRLNVIDVTVQSTEVETISRPITPDPINENADDKATIEVEKVNVECSKVCSDFSKDTPAQIPSHDSIDFPPHITASNLHSDATTNACIDSPQQITHHPAPHFSTSLKQACSDKKSITANGISSDRTSYQKDNNSSQSD